ncbi:MAG: hypothetical protein J6L77_00665 [Coprococcus sp.]|nr:hypothetical protein [Coprococcus sp.]
MVFGELAAERYSIRSFSDRPIEQEKTDKVLKAGQLARRYSLLPDLLMVRRLFCEYFNT